MVIRKLEEKDLDLVRSMMKVFYASDALLLHPSDAVQERTLKAAVAGGPYVTGYGFETEQGLAGYGIVTHSFSTEAGGICLWIEDIYIKPEFRGQGMGTAFLRFVEENAGEGTVRLRLEAEPENEKAISVYQNAGYSVLGYTQLVKEL